MKSHAIWMGIFGKGYFCVAMVFPTCRKRQKNPVHMNIVVVFLYILLSVAVYVVSRQPEVV